MQLGARVSVRDVDSRRETTYTLVSATEANPLEGRISDASPPRQGAPQTLRGRPGRGGHAPREDALQHSQGGFLAVAQAIARVIAAAKSSGWRSMLWLAACGVIGLPAFILRYYGVNIDPALAAFVFGMGILGAAFLLSWAAEAAQHDMSAALAIAILALIAVLPEYAVEAVLAWDAGQSFSSATGEVTEEMSRGGLPTSREATGWLIGIGWSAVILIFWFRRRRPLDLRGYLSLELVLLSAATALSFIIFVTGQVHMALAGVLIALYVFYLWQSSRQEAVEPDLLGPALAIGNLSRPRRRAVVLALFVYAAAVILVAAEPFVEALVGTGEDLGIEEFILIQWVAPLASESPEIIVAVLFSLQAQPGGRDEHAHIGRGEPAHAAHREHGRHIQHRGRRAAELRSSTTGRPSSSSSRRRCPSSRFYSSSPV